MNHDQDNSYSYLNDTCNERKERRSKRKRDKDHLSKRTHNIDLNTQPDEIINTEYQDPMIVKEEPSLEQLETEPIYTNDQGDPEMEELLNQDNDKKP